VAPVIYSMHGAVSLGTYNIFGGMLTTEQVARLGEASMVPARRDATLLMQVERHQV